MLAIDPLGSNTLEVQKIMWGIEWNTCKRKGRGSQIDQRETQYAIWIWKKKISANPMNWIARKLPVRGVSPREEWPDSNMLAMFSYSKSCPRRVWPGLEGWDEFWTCCSWELLANYSLNSDASSFLKGDPSDYHSPFSVLHGSVSLNISWGTSSGLHGPLFLMGNLEEEV